ncbi:MAG: glutamate racemase [Henriciella sp.]
MSSDSMALRGKVLVFDSGMGGLTVAREISGLAPDVAVDYAADNGFFPYGDKSDAALQARLPGLAAKLVHASGPDVFVIACNTASTLALEAVRARLDIPVVGTVPAIKPAAAQSQSRRIGLLATPGTIRRAYTAELVREFASDVDVFMHGSIDLVHLAERQAAGEAVPLQAFRQALEPLFNQPGAGAIDTLVLACTHFPLIRGELAAAVPHPVSFIDSGEAIARQTLRQLGSGGRESEGGRVFLTGAPETSDRLVEVCRRFGFGTVTCLVHH